MKSKKIHHFVLGSVFFTLLACNIASPQNLSATERAPTQPPESTNTPVPFSTQTPRPSLTPTASYTPMPLQQLTVHNYLNFIQPLPLSLSSTEPTYVSGMVYNGDGVVPNATVVLSDSSCGPPVAETKTDSQGRYTLTDIRAGVYYLEVFAFSTSALCGEKIVKNPGVGLVKDLIAAPYLYIITSPKEGQILTEDMPIITWDAVRNAAVYTITVNIKTSETRSEFFEAWLTNSTSFTFPHKLDKSKTYLIILKAYTTERLPLGETRIEIHY